MALIWQDLLGLEQVGRKDDFFELGGHSLLAVQLLSRIRSEIGMEAPLRKLFVHPTLCEFAAALIDQPADAAYSHLAPIRTKGSGRPLFLVHPRGGQAGYARALASYLDEALPVYGLNASGLVAGETPLTSIEAMAGCYLHEIRRVQPEGPYRVAGYSSGGVIAYEMASQLIAADQCVEFVGLIDTYAEGAAGDVREDFDECAFLFNELLKADNPPVPSIMARLKALADGGDFAAMLAQCRSAKLIADDIDQDFVRRYLAVYHATDRALKAYTPAPVSAPISLFGAVEERDADDASLGWSAIAGSCLEIIPVGGTHSTIVEEPHIRRLAELVTQALTHAGQRVSAHPEQAYSPRMLIQNGHDGIRPLFCIPGAGASVTTFYQLAQALDAELPVYGMQPRGLDGVLVPHGDVQAAARAYIKAIREISPNGPYRLIGHSFGGWVAFEAALQLTSEGGQVDMLVLLDSEAPSARERRQARYSRVDVLMALVGLFESGIEQSLALTRADLEPLDHDSQLALLLSRLIDVKLMPPRTGIQTLRGIVRVFGTNLNTHYTPERPYSGPLHLVAADRSDNRADMMTGWRQHAPNAAFLSVPGNHITLLAAPYVTKLAEWLQSLIGGE